MKIYNSDSYLMSISFSEETITNSKINTEIISDPGLPAFVIIGPPKSGTTSLGHTLNSKLDNFHLYTGNNGENHFWNGANEYRCLPDYGNITWQLFINSWNKNQIKLSYLNHSCSLDRYQSIWQYTMCNQLKNITDITCKVSYKNHKEKDCEKKKVINSSIPYCYFIETAQTYLRSPLIPIIYAMNMPKTKLLGIIRNPVSMWWSWGWHFHKKYINKKYNKYENKSQSYLIEKMERYLTKEFIKPGIGTHIVDVRRAFDELSSECNKMNDYDAFNSYDEKFDKFYRNYMGLYLKLKFVNGWIEPRVRREPDAMMFSALIFPTMLFWIHAYDEVYGRYSSWNQVRFIQFEWLYDDKSSGKAFNMIYCWITYDKYKCPFTNDNRFEVNVLRENKRSIGEYSNNYSIVVQDLYRDCNHALQNILLKERPNLLIGEWIDW